MLSTVGGITHPFAEKGDGLPDLAQPGLDAIVVGGDSETAGFLFPLELIEQYLILEPSPLRALVVSIVDESVEREFGHGGQ